MRKLLVGTVLGLSSVLAMAKPGAIQGQAVVKVVEDGDTLLAELLDGTQVWVRLHLADAPEVCHRKRDPQCKKAGQPFGREATEALSHLVAGKVVDLRCRGESYGRPVCDVGVQGRDVASAMILGGWAWYSPYRSDKSSTLSAAEQAARLAGRGVWSAPDPVRPADWRRSCWQEGHCPGK